MMKIVKSDVKAELKKYGRFTVAMRGVTATIRLTAGQYEIIVQKHGFSSDYWTYRRESIALDRFAEKCSNLRRRS